MKTLILALPFMFLFALQLQAQGPQSLTFTISDTLWIEANYLELKITHYVITQETDEPEYIGGKEISFEELKEFCSVYDIRSIHEEKDVPTSSNGYREKLIILKFTSRKELLACLKEVNKFAHVIPMVQNLRLKDVESYNGKIFIQTLESGKLKAAKRATLLKQKVKALQSVEEIHITQMDPRELRDKYAGGWTIYPPLSALAPDDFPINTQVPLICTLKLSFELE